MTSTRISPSPGCWPAELNLRVSVSRLWPWPQLPPPPVSRPVASRAEPRLAEPRIEILADVGLEPASGAILGRGTYHPGLARFISEDPVSFAGGDLNVYAYVRDDPLNFTDPVGLWLCRMNLPGLGDALVDDSVANAVAEFYGRAHSLGVRLKFTSAFRTTEEQTLEFQSNPRATKPGTSLHEAGFAVDISWSSIPPQLRSRVVSAARAAGLDWGGRFPNNYDPYHFYMDVPGGPSKRSKFIERAQQQQSKSQGDIPYCQ